MKKHIQNAYLKKIESKLSLCGEYTEVKLRMHIRVWGLIFEIHGNSTFLCTSNSYIEHKIFKLYFKLQFTFNIIFISFTCTV